MKQLRHLTSFMAIACGAIVMVSCSKTTDIFNDTNSLENKTKAFNEAFVEQFGAPASNHDWGFSNLAIESVIESEGSWAYTSTVVPKRAVALSVTPVTKKTYDSKETLLKETSATCYFYLKIDNKIIAQETVGVQYNPRESFYPLDRDLGNGVIDNCFNTDNEGKVNVAKWKALGLIDDNHGLSFATINKAIPENIFDMMPSFDAMIKHVPDADKIKLAGSVEKLNSDNYKIFYYVCKYQASDKVIHVDGVLVPKDQITVNIPEYKKRIIVEDLKGNINATTKIKESDFDYNDVVFDAITWQDVNKKNHLKVIVRAAGGTLPIYVKGKEIHEGIGYMFNTSNPDYEYGYELIDDEIIGENASSFNFNNIPVEVEVDGTRVAAGANIGEAPEKIAVGLDYKWCQEKNNIKNIYPKFSLYVTDKTITDWYK